MRIGSGVDNIDVKVAEFVVYPDFTFFQFYGFAIAGIRIDFVLQDPDLAVMKLRKYFFNAASHPLTYEFFLSSKIDL